MKRFLMVLAGAWLACGFNAHANVISDFSSDDDGWRSVTLDFRDPGTPPTLKYVRSRLAIDRGSP